MPKKATAGISLPKTGAANLTFLSGGGEMGERMRAFDWSTSPVGPPAEWPPSLKTAVSICIGSRYPIVLWWGHPEYTMFYNDGYIPVLGVTKHPGWLGRSGRECWKEIWSTVGPMLDGVFKTGVATWSEDLLLIMNRNLEREEVYFTFSYSPIHGDAGSVDGIFCACYETTSRVIGERRLQTLRDLGRRVMEVKSAEEACQAAARTLGANPHDVPFSLMYLLDERAEKATLCASTGFEVGCVNAPESIDMNEPVDSVKWPLRRVFETAAGEVVTGIKGLPGGAWPESSESALVLPITAPGYTKPIVHSLVEMHGGEICAASDGKGEGATFTLTLPILALSESEDGGPGPVEKKLLSFDPNQNGINLSSSEPHSDLLRGLKVLTVDDQQDTRELIALALGRYGAEVRSSDSASHALETIKDWKPHVVVSDIGLPEMDGYDFLRRLREIEGDGERIPAIAVTGYAGALDESKALNAGYAIHLSKPIELNALATAIAKVSRKV